MLWSRLVQDYFWDVPESPHVLEHMVVGRTRRKHPPWRNGIPIMEALGNLRRLSWRAFIGIHGWKKYGQGTLLRQGQGAFALAENMKDSRRFRDRFMVEGF